MSHVGGIERAISIIIYYLENNFKRKPFTAMARASSLDPGPDQPSGVRKAIEKSLTKSLQNRGNSQFRYFPAAEHEEFL